MSEDLPDLEPIDVAEESRRAAAWTATDEATPTGATPPAMWAPGWYADPWTAGQYRYWSGQSWTGETSRWGPANAATARTSSANDPWATSTAPVSSDYRPPVAAAEAGVPPPAGSPRRRGPVIVGVTALIVAVLLSGAIGFGIDSRSHSNSNAQSPSAVPFIPGATAPSPTSPNGSATTPTTIPASAISHDPDRHALADVVVRQSDVPKSRTVVLIPNGNLLSEPTLDLCNGTFPSERLRTARLQVADVDSESTLSLSTEAVLYRNAAASTQALAELRDVSGSCPHHPVVSPVGEQTSETTFDAWPDGSWPRNPTVDRQAYSFVSKSPATANTPATSTPSVAVYLRRGRALLGLYFADPKGRQPPVAGKTTIEGIVGVFEARMAALPKSVVGAG